jgi:hypothetical protein
MASWSTSSHQPSPRTFSPPVGTVAEMIQDQPGHRGSGSLGEFHPQVGKVMDGERLGQDQGPSGSWWADATSRSNSL